MTPGSKAFTVGSKNMEEYLLKSEEVASILHVSRSFAYLLMKRGDIPTVRIGTAVRVRPEDLEQYIQKRASENATISDLLDRKA
jgi:excisionase family DNA binding protein